MTESIQRATCELSDGSRIEIAVTRAAAAPGSKSTPQGGSSAANAQAENLVAKELPSADELLRILQQYIAALRLPKPTAAAAARGLVGKSPSMQNLVRMIDKVAPTQASVLITGENGTGKELVARAIHLGSARKERPFVAANVSAFNDNLLESELFGHKRGAFTGAVADKRGLFEEADTGTFLLDEVGDMSPALQSKLLRVLQEGTFMPVGGTQTKKVDVRIIAATNRDLAAMVKKGTFREDLYYRLNVVALRTPALRERGADLDVLLDHFLAKLAERHGKDKRLSPEARSALRLHAWPGNVRELQNESERIWVLSGDEPMIGLEHLSRPLVQAYLERESRTPASATAASAPPSNAAAEEEPLTQILERVERDVIERVLAKVAGNRSRAAQLLGISRRNLLRKLELLGLASGDDGDA
jgi:two-component system, NtrC family, response regulator HupR/HoxA